MKEESDKIRISGVGWEGKYWALEFQLIEKCDERVTNKIEKVVIIAINDTTEMSI